MKAKKLKNCKNGDTIYIYDFNEISKGFQKFKVIDIKHVEATNDDWCSCGGGEPEHWFIHFDSPYLDRTITVYSHTDTYVIYNGKYAENINGKAIVKDIQLAVFTDIHGAKYKIFQYYNNKINSLKSEMNRCDKQIEALQTKKMQCSLEIGNINDELLQFETNVNEKV